MATIRGNASRRFVPTRWRQGLPLAIAVLAAWGLSVAVGLPESFWSVMSVLIVMRPSAGSTLGAGWERVRGTAVGAAVGLAGVYLQHHGAPALATTLSLVALLGLVGGAFPGMRSAPVAALIILSAGGIPGHSALQVAVLRVVQIGIGVAVALLISMIAAEYRAGPRFREGCAALLQRVAMRVAALAGEARPSEDAADGANAATRAALARLTVLADSADRESALWRWRRSGRRAGSANDDGHGRSANWRRVARMVTRIFQDATVLGRVFRRVPDSQNDPLWTEVARTASRAIANTADVLGSHGRVNLVALESLALRCAEPMPDRPSYSGPSTLSTTLLAAPLALLRDDLERLQALLDELE